jgi:hypothetical protein
MRIFSTEATAFTFLLHEFQMLRNVRQQLHNTPDITSLVTTNSLSPTMRTSSVALFVILSAHETPRVNSQGSLRGSKNQASFVLGTIAPCYGGSTNYLGDRRTRRRKMGDGLERGDDREGHSNLGSTCVDQRVTKTWNNIKLSPDNSIPRSTGLDSAFGTASVSLVRSKSCRVGANFEVCISAEIRGSLSWRLHLTRGRIITNGPAVADFSGQILQVQSGLNVCTPISESLYIELMNAPVRSTRLKPPSVSHFPHKRKHSL